MKQAISRKNLWEKTPWAVKATVGRALGIVPQRYLLGRRGGTCGGSGTKEVALIWRGLPSCPSGLPAR